MKKFLLIIFIFMLLTACSKRDNFPINDLRGTYLYDECVYLSPLVSVSMDAVNEVYRPLVSIEVTETKVTYNNMQDQTRIFDDVTYKEQPIMKNIDEVLHAYGSDIIDSFEYRYDIYQNDSYTGLTIFMNGDEVYFCEMNVLSQSENEYLIWIIFSVIQS